MSYPLQSFEQAMEMLWLGITDPRRHGLDPLLLSSGLRRLARGLRPLLGEAGWGMMLQDDGAYRGGEYLEVFFDDIRSILERQER